MFLENSLSTIVWYRLTQKKVSVHYNDLTLYGDERSTAIPMRQRRGNIVDNIACSRKLSLMETIAQTDQSRMESSLFSTGFAETCGAFVFSSDCLTPHT